MSDTVLVAIITAVVTIVGGALTFRQQIVKTREESEVQIERLKQEIESDLWARVKSELSEVQKELEAERRLRKALELELNAERELRKKAERELNEERKLRVALQKENDALRAGKK